METGLPQDATRIATGLPQDCHRIATGLPQAPKSIKVVINKPSEDTLRNLENVFIKRCCQHIAIN
jgi:hypothetical protein